MSDRPRPFSTADDVPGDLEARLGEPGSYPYTRGIHRDMYAGRPWSIRQYAGFGTAEETNRRFRFLIGQGQAALSVAFDLPTQMGLDSDDARAAGEVGRVGVAIDSASDVEAMFDGIPLDEVSTSMTINAPAAVLVAMYHVACARQGRDPSQIRGTAQNDVLKEYVSRGTYIFPPRPSLRLAADLIAWCAEQAPRFNAISLSGYHMREAGCTAAQEMGFAVANAIAYMQAVVERGVDVDRFAPRLSWIFNTHINFFEEIGKYSNWCEAALHYAGLEEAPHRFGRVAMFGNDSFERSLPALSRGELGAELVEMHLGCSFFAALAFNEPAKLAELFADSGDTLGYRFEFQGELSPLAAESFHLEIRAADFSLQPASFAICPREALFSLG